MVLLMIHFYLCIINLPSYEEWLLISVLLSINAGNKNKGMHYTFIVLSIRNGTQYASHKLNKVRVCKISYTVLATVFGAISCFYPMLFCTRDIVYCFSSCIRRNLFCIYPILICTRDFLSQYYYLLMLEIKIKVCITHSLSCQSGMELSMHLTNWIKFEFVSERWSLHIDKLIQS
jgi:hypothetical protein